MAEQPSDAPQEDTGQQQRPYYQMTPEEQAKKKKEVLKNRRDYFALLRNRLQEAEVHHYKEEDDEAHTESGRTISDLANELNRKMDSIYESWPAEAADGWLRTEGRDLVLSYNHDNRHFEIWIHPDLTYNKKLKFVAA